MVEIKSVEDYLSLSELNSMNPCCLNCEFVGEVERHHNIGSADTYTTRCQRMSDSLAYSGSEVCHMWKINMDIE